MQFIQNKLKTIILTLFVLICFVKKKLLQHAIVGVHRQQ